MLRTNSQTLRIFRPDQPTCSVKSHFQHTLQNKMTLTPRFIRYLINSVASPILLFRPAIGISSSTGGGFHTTNSLSPHGAPSSVTTSMSAGGMPVMRSMCWRGLEIVALQETNLTWLSKGR